MRVVSCDVVGMVIFTGKERRIEMNRSSPKTKFGVTDGEIDKLVLVLFLFSIFMILVLTVFSGKFFHYSGLIFAARVLIIYSIVIPSSMKINLEFGKFYYTHLINRDGEIWGTTARNSNIPEELGRIDFLLSDKTGTLTKNEMLFKHMKSPLFHYCQDNFHILQKDLQSQSQDSLLHKMLETFLVCNNITPIEDKHERTLQASSPDEVALVRFAEQ